MSTRHFRSSEEAAEILRGLLGLEDAPPRTLLVAAHPDDEVVGAGGHLIRLGGQALIAHVTDGAAADADDARASGFATAADYARERHEESLRALALAGVPAANCWSLGFGDQRASLALGPIVRAVAAAIEETSPALVLTHPYEGGHPDHDATAFAVAAACRVLERRKVDVPILAEFTSYHRGPDGIRTGRFLERTNAEIELPLTESMQAVKRAMLEMFATQQRMLVHFPVVEFERFRIAPAYDFTKAPHDGRLYYEHHNWGMDGMRWRALARAAAAEFGA